MLTEVSVGRDAEVVEGSIVWLVLKGAIVDSDRLQSMVSNVGVLDSEKYYERQRQLAVIRFW
jgi:hypothetical protein